MIVKFVERNWQRILFLLLTTIILFITILSNSLNSFYSNYDFSNVESINLTENMEFKVVDYNSKKTCVLRFKGEDEKYDSEMGIYQSVFIGKYCVSLISTNLNTQKIVNINSLKSLLNDVSIKLNGEISKISEFSGTTYAYILSKNNDTYFIDFMTVSPYTKKLVLYNRFLIQDTRSLNVDISETEYDLLTDVLPEIQKICGIKEKLEIPIYDLVQGD